jgi:hypothetical protein
MTRALFAAALLACASKPPAHVDIQPLPSHQESAETKSLDDLACEPAALSPIAVNELEAALANQRDFAQRCCTGDESGDATVHVTVTPAGYETRITIDPERMRGDATGACIYGTFHRVLVLPFDGAEKTASVVVHIR